MAKRRKKPDCLRCKTIEIADKAVLKMLKRKTINTAKIRDLVAIIRDFEVNPCRCGDQRIAGEVTGALVDAVRRG